MDVSTLDQRLEMAAMKFKGVPPEQARQDGQAEGASRSSNTGNGVLAKGQQGPLSNKDLAMDQPRAVPMC
jgi:hypothetical protein